MAGPWEQYAPQTPPAAGPWARYQAAAPDAAPPASTSATQLATNVGAGTNEFVSDAIGAPVDVATWGLNKGGDLINLIFGPDTVGRIQDPIGGSQSIRDLQSLYGGSPDQVAAPTEADRIARGAGYGLAASLLPAGAAAGAGPMVRAVTGAPTVGNAIVGAVAGASGTAAADAVPEPLKPLVGMLAGLFGGGAATTVGQLGRAGGSAVGNMVRGGANPAGRGDDLLVQSIMRDSTSPEQMAQSVDDAARAGNPDFAAVDAAGRNTQRLAAMAAKTPGTAREEMAQAAAARQAGQGDRIGAYVDTAVAPGGGAYTTEQALLESRRNGAAPFYEEAYTSPPPAGPVYDNLLQRRSVQDAIVGAQRVAAERQVPISDMFAEVPNPAAVGETMRIPTVRGWDFIKRELDGQVDRLYRSGDTTAAGAIKETRDALRTQLGDDIPAYRQALARYTDDSASIDAVQAGRDLAKAPNPDAAAVAFSDLDEGQQGLARIGASREIGAKLENARTGQDKTLLFDTPNMSRKLDVLATDPTARAAFGQQLDRERSMVRSNRQMQGGSNTFENLADAGDASGVVGGVVQNLARGRSLTGTAVDAVGRMVGGALRVAQGFSPEVAQRVASYLLSADPDEIRSLTAAFQRVQAGQLPEGEFARQIIGADFRSSAIGVGTSEQDRGDPTVNAIMGARRGVNR